MVRIASDSCNWVRPAQRIIIVTYFSLTLAACGGGGGSRPGSANTVAASGSAADSTPAPELTLAVTPERIVPGGSAELSWSSSAADTCEASSGWHGLVGASGSRTVGPLQDTASFRLSCSGPGGGISRKVTVRVVDEALSIDLAVSRERIGIDDSVQIRWTAAGAIDCTASGGWTGDQPVAGSVDSGPLEADTSFQLSCSNGTENEIASVSVEVVDKALEWQSPTHNVDGSRLKDLAGYTIYWGQESRRYTGSKRINTPDRTRWVPDLPEGTYLFALTAFDSRGVESDYSNEIEKFIP